MAKQAPAAAMQPQVASQDEQPKKKSGKKKLMFFILLALLMIGSAAVAIVMMKPASQTADDAEAAAVNAAESQRASAPVFLTLEPFVVNLRGEDGDNYLRVGVVLEATSQAAIEAAKIQLPRIRNGIILLLSAKTMDELSSLEGKRQLMEEIVVEARKPMTLPEPSKGIESVYLSDFVIQ